MTGTQIRDTGGTRCGACGHYTIQLARCLCGHLVTDHDIERKRAQPCSHMSCGCRDFRPDDEAVSA